MKLGKAFKRAFASKGSGSLWGALLGVALAAATPGVGLGTLLASGITTGELFESAARKTTPFVGKESGARHVFESLMPKLPKPDLSGLEQEFKNLSDEQKRVMEREAAQRADEKLKLEEEKKRRDLDEADILRRRMLSMDTVLTGPLGLPSGIVPVRRSVLG